MSRRRNRVLKPIGKIALAAALAVLMPTGAVALAQVETSITFESNTEPDAEPITGSYTDLSLAADGVNGAVVQGPDADNPPGSSHDANLTITLNGNVAVATDDVAAVFNGAGIYMVTVERQQTDPDTGDPVFDPDTGEPVMEEVEEERKAWNGFKNVTLNGQGASITGALYPNLHSGSLLSIEHVQGSITVSSLKVNSGSSDVSGGGLYLGLLRDSDPEAPMPQGFQSLNLNDATFDRNVVDGYGDIFGGGLAINNLTTSSSTVSLDGVDLTRNVASGYGTVSFGGGAGLRDSGSGHVTFTYMDSYLGKSDVSNNLAYIMNGDYAAGGGLAVEVNGQLSAFISSAAFSDNKAMAEATSDFWNPAAVGGGVALFGNADSTFYSVSFEGNQADASLGGNAYGGGLFAQGSVLLTNSSFTDNQAISGSATGTQALGGAVFIDASVHSDTGNGLTLAAATEADQVLISGNTANGKSSGIHFGNAQDTNIQNDVEFNIQGLGQVKMMDALSVALNSNQSFTLNKEDDGLLIWDADNNSIAGAGEAEINLKQGTTELTKDFSLAVTDNTNFGLNFSKEGTNKTVLNFDSRRDAQMAMFDLTGAGNINSVLVELASTDMNITNTRRQLVDFDDEYLIVKGAGSAAADMASELNNLLLHKNIGDSKFVGTQGGNVVLEFVYDSPYTRALTLAGKNTVSGASALTELLQYDNFYEGLTDEEALTIIHANYGALTPEYGTVAGAMGLNVTQFINRMAVRQGLRGQHSSSLPVPLSVQPSFGGPHEGVRIWGGYAGNFRKVNDAGGYYGYDQDTSAAMLGLSYDLGPEATIGVFGGYSNNKADLNRISSEVESDGTHIGLLARLSPGASIDPNLAIYLDASYSRYENDAYRRLNSQKVRSDFDQTAYSGGIGVEYAVPVSYEVLLTPSLDLRYTKLEQDSYREKGLTANYVKGYDVNSFTSSMALTASREISIKGGTITPSARLGWNHEYGDTDVNTTARYLGPSGSPMPSAYKLGTVDQNRDSMDAGVGLKALLNSGSYHQVGLNVSYDVNISKDADTHSVYGGLEYNF